MFTDRVRDYKIADLVFFEVFSGTAGLTAAVRRMGCQHGAGIDAHVTKQVKAPVIRPPVKAKNSCGGSYNNPGCLQFTLESSLPKVVAAHMRRFSHFEGVVGDAPLDDSLRNSLIFLRDRVLTGEPRQILADVGRMCHLYTDASLEDGAGGLVGVLSDGAGMMLSFFSETMTAAEVTLLNPRERKGLIFELEALASAIGVM